MDLKSTKWVTTRTMNEIYEWAKVHGYEYEDMSFNARGDKFFQAFKRKTLDEERHIYLQHKLQNCLLTSGKYIMSITTTLYNKSGQIGRIEVTMPVESKWSIDRAEQEEEAIIKIAKNCGII